MKKLFTVSSLIVVVFFLTTAFNNQNEPHKIIQERYEKRLQNFTAALQEFYNAVNKNEGSEQIQKNYLSARKAFKEWEYLGEYLDPMFIKDNINGAPLPKLERNSFGINIMEPKGLQVLDELVYAGDINENKEEILLQTKRMIELLTEYGALHKPIYDWVVLDAARTELVRLFTLGFTGFDVPGSGNSVNDAIAVLSSLRQDLNEYRQFFIRTDVEGADKFYKTLDAAIAYLQQHNDFDNLDRLHVLTEYINPLYADLLSLHKKSGIEMVHEVVQEHLLPPYNHQSDNLFANDFLNPFVYMGLPKELYNEQLVTLGKTLFFDPILSASNTRSCAGCHNPQKAFTDGEAKSIAMDFDGTVSRNAPTLINCVYSERFFHDMRAEAPEDQIEHVLTSRKEFATSMMGIIGKLQQSKEYTEMFDAALKDYKGADKINGQTIAFAISAYVSSLRGFNSPFDKYVRGETDHLDASVRRGFNLFMGKAACGTCHFAPAFNGTVPPRYEESESEVLAVPEDPYAAKPVLDPDEGRGNARLKEVVYFYQYSFKTPTVRNIALTAPYMHNGAYRTLEDVMDFYNKGGGKGIGIIVEHQTLPFDSLGLTKQETGDIIAFMKALTDTTGMTAPPAALPKFAKQTAWNDRKIGGEY